jgi:two-component system sensor histidine kinase YesM
LVIQGIVLSFSISDLISNKIYDTSTELLGQRNLRLNERLNEIRQISLSIVINNEIKEILEHASVRDSYQQIRDNQSISNLLSNVANSRKDISQIIIVTDRMSVYNYSNVNGLVEKNLVKDKKFFQYVTDKEEGIIATKENFIRYDSSDKYVVTFFRKLVSANNKELGTLCIVLNEKGLRNIVQEHTTKDSNKITFIIDKEGNVVSPYDNGSMESGAIIKNFFQESERISNDKMHQTVKINGEKYLVISTTPNTFGWKIVQFIPYAEIDEGISIILRTIIYIGLICFSFAVFFLFRFSKSIIKPIKELVQQMGVVGSGTFDVSIKDGYISEIEELNNGFEKMTLQIKQLLTEIDVEHQRMRQAELSALQSQINPHFLYNTLDSINWMAINIRAYDISKMVSDLGQLFRLSLNKGKDMTLIKNEIEHLRCYMRIQAYRYNNKFTFIEQYDPEIFQYQTVKLILQPLVENCLIHGFCKTKGEGEIKIEGRFSGNDIIFVISDNGSGLDSKSMNECLKENKSDSKGGCGIKNVNARIKIRFGQEYGLTYLTVERGTSVQIKIPQIQYEEVKNVVQNADCR